ncbi:class I SAM-dependent methyltransferase [Capnocytophaga sp. oral taxon 878]|uniref:class I SAM-dependent methyltransferase n=1 Tax=Capnocytophaga sp. oral taxon 878 TaxID=1316596 RepID=UPI000D045796|nr:class I SAM-dependent methyltransferase [Capnocytophaga sp. oral taxon 878]AVM50899.1 methyltransferase [Capnocytophaga sp. oral taxon 878]
MNITDYSISHETFKLEYNPQLQLYHTTPVPENLSTYYESENYISHTDSHKTLTDKLYQWVKQYNLQHKINLIKKYKKESINLLDIGAGTGDFVLACQNHAHWQATGIEPSTKARIKAQEKQLILHPDTTNLLPHSYNVITMWHVLEHIPDVTAQIQTISNLLTPDGIVIIAVPNYLSWDAQHYKEYWAAYDVPRHLWHFSKYSIKQLFSQQNFQLLAIHPMLFDAFYVSMLSEKYKTGKTSLLKGFLSGIRSNYYGWRKKEYSSHIYILKRK